VAERSVTTGLDSQTNFPAPEGRQTEVMSVAPPGLGNPTPIFPAPPPPANIWPPLRGYVYRELTARRTLVPARYFSIQANSRRILSN